MIIETISSREREVMEKISHGLTTIEIASALYISADTVKTHKKNLFQKLSVHNAAGLVRRGFEMGFLEPKLQPARYQLI